MKLTFGNDRVFGLAMHSLVPRPLKRTLPSAFAHATYRTMDVASVYIVTRRVGPPDELIQSRLRGGKQGCLDVFDGFVCSHWEGRHEVASGTDQAFTNR